MADRHQFRAKWHSYEYGIYFVTICSHKKTHIFGQINANEMRLNMLGHIVESCIKEIPSHHSDVEILNYVVMPNHVHMVIAVGTRYIASASTQGNIASASTQGNIASTSRQGNIASASRQGNIASTSTQGNITSYNLGCLKPPKHGNVCGDFHHNSRLSVIIGSFKSAVTRFANNQMEQSRGGRDVSRPYWQPRYHDHIIRNQRAFENIMMYVDTNVERWHSDCFNN